MKANRTVVHGVHAVRAAEVRPTEHVCSTEAKALQHAATLSSDPGVLAAAVTRFVVDELGSRTGIALFVNGERQQVPHVSDNRRK